MVGSICTWARSPKVDIRLGRRRYRVACMALTSLALVFGTTVAAGASSAHLKDRSTPAGLLVPSGQHVTVTGFASVSPANPSSGPISVRISRVQTTQLVSIVNHLPVIKAVGCMEDSLLYKIVFRSSDHSRSDFVVNAYTCDAVVEIRGAGRFVTRRDSTCSLVRIVRDDLPAKAHGTKVAGVGCNA
jgi:hypothetical protein